MWVFWGDCIGGLEVDVDGAKDTYESDSDWGNDCSGCIYFNLYWGIKLFNLVLIFVLLTVCLPDCNGTSWGVEFFNIN